MSNSETAADLREDLLVLCGIATAHYDLSSERIARTLSETGDRMATEGPDAFMMSNPDREPLPDDVDTQLAGDLSMVAPMYLADPFFGMEVLPKFEGTVIEEFIDDAEDGLSEETVADVCRDLATDIRAGRFARFLRGDD